MKPRNTAGGREFQDRQEVASMRPGHEAPEYGEKIMHIHITLPLRFNEAGA